MLIPTSHTARGYALTFRSSKSTSPLLTEHDEPRFAHLILFAPLSKSESNGSRLARTNRHTLRLIRHSCRAFQACPKT